LDTFVDKGSQGRQQSSAASVRESSDDLGRPSETAADLRGSGGCCHSAGAALVSSPPTAVYLAAHRVYLAARLCWRPITT
jgi:hypothetical protein